MKTKWFTRFLASCLSCLLFLGLFPHPRAQALEDEVRRVTVEATDLTCDSVLPVEMLVNAQGYYMSIGEVNRLLGTRFGGETETGRQYITPNNTVFLTPNLAQLDTIELDGETYYPLLPLMNEFQTTIFATENGRLAYNSVPKNTHRLLVQTAKICATNTYNADFLKDLKIGKRCLELCAMAYATAMRLDFSALKGYQSEMEELMLKLIQPPGDSDQFYSLLGNVNQGLSTLGGIAMKIDGIGNKEALSLIFGEPMAENIRDCIATLDIANGDSAFTELYREVTHYYPDSSVGEKDILPKIGGLGLGDVLSIAGYVNNLGKATTYYADALERTLDWCETTGIMSTLPDRMFFSQGRVVLGDFRAYTQSHMEVMIDAILPKAIDAVAKNMTKDVVKSILGLGPMMLTADVMKLIDGFWGNPIKKNEAVRYMFVCGWVQDVLSQAYAEAWINAPKTERPLLCRDIALLYLKTTWAAYDCASFDDSLESSIKSVQKRLVAEMDSLSVYEDWQFTFVKNETPIIDGMLGGTPAGATMGQYSNYEEFLKSWDWLNYADIDYMSVDDISGEYFLHDIDHDGVTDLIIRIETSMASGNCLCFTLKDGVIYGMGMDHCGGREHISASDRKNGLLLSGAHTGIAWHSLYEIKNGVISLAAEEEFHYEQGETGTLDISGWYELEGRDVPRPDDGVRWKFRNLVEKHLGLDKTWTLESRYTRQDWDDYTQNYCADLTFRKDGSVDVFMYHPYSGVYDEPAKGGYSINGDRMQIWFAPDNGGYFSFTYQFDPETMTFTQLSDHGLSWLMDDYSIEEKGTVCQLKENTLSDTSADGQQNQPSQNAKLGDWLSYGKPWMFATYYRPSQYNQSDEPSFISLTFSEDGTLQYHCHDAESVPYNDYSGYYSIDGNNLKINLQLDDGLGKTHIYEMNFHDSTLTLVSEDGLGGDAQKGDVFDIVPDPWCSAPEAPPSGNLVEESLSFERVWCYDYNPYEEGTYAGQAGRACYVFYPDGRLHYVLSFETGIAEACPGEYHVEGNDLFITLDAYAEYYTFFYHFDPEERTLSCFGDSECGHYEEPKPAVCLKEDPVYTAADIERLGRENCFWWPGNEG